MPVRHLSSWYPSFSHPMMWPPYRTASHQRANGNRDEEVHGEEERQRRPKLRSTVELLSISSGDGFSN
jgi:hypothetical protein